MGIEDDPLWWKKMGNLQVKGDRVSLDTDREPIWGGWWQVLRDENYNLLDEMVNGEKDIYANTKNKQVLMWHGLFFEPRTKEEGIIRIMAIEEEMRRVAVKPNLLSFTVMEKPGGTFEDVELIDIIHDPSVGLGWGKIVMIVNRSVENSIGTQISLTNNFITRLNKRLVGLEQPRIPLLSPNSY